jgi:hypothetical protein
MQLEFAGVMKIGSDRWFELHQKILCCVAQLWLQYILVREWGKYCNVFWGTLIRISKGLQETEKIVNCVTEWGRLYHTGQKQRSCMCLNTSTGFCHLVFVVGSTQSAALIETALSDEAFVIRFNVQRPSLYCQLNTAVMINCQHQAYFSSDSRSMIRCTQSTV